MGRAGRGQRGRGGQRPAPPPLSVGPGSRKHGARSGWARVPQGRTARAPAETMAGRPRATYMISRRRAGRRNGERGAAAHGVSGPGGVSTRSQLIPSAAPRAPSPPRARPTQRRAARRAAARAGVGAGDERVGGVRCARSPLSGSARGHPGPPTPRSTAATAAGCGPFWCLLLAAPPAGQLRRLLRLLLLSGCCSSSFSSSSFGPRAGREATGASAPSGRSACRFPGGWGEGTRSPPPRAPASAWQPWDTQRPPPLPAVPGTPGTRASWPRRPPVPPGGPAHRV